MTPALQTRPWVVDVADGVLPENLSGAIRAFNACTDELRHEYERLRSDFEHVSVELTTRNGELAASLRRVEEVSSHLESVLENLSVGVIACNLEGHVTLVNPGFERLTGYAAGDLRGRRMPAGFPQLPVILESAGAHPAELTRADGESIPVECDTVVMRGEGGEPRGWIVLVRDLRPVRELERKVQQSRSLAALGELAAGIVHEVRNPLSGIEGFGSLLLRTFEPGDSRHRLTSKLLDGVHDLKSIVDDLLILARPAALHMRPVGVRGIVSHAMELALSGRGTGEAPIELQHDVGPDGLTVQADPRTLTQVLVNLLRNAAEAIPDGGRIAVASFADGEEGVVISVTDTGAGMDASVRAKIFTPFFTTKKKGTGLGLFIARSIIRAHGGDISLDSAEGGGTRVRLWLRRAAGAPAVSAA